MFDELNKYKHHGHFFLNLGESLAIASREVPNEPGVYYILRLASGKVDLVYIGRSGTMLQNRSFKSQLLRKRINNRQKKSLSRQQFFAMKMEKEAIDALDIYWFVTFDEQHQDLPGYVEGTIMQRYFDVHGCLPPWNTEF